MIVDTNHANSGKHPFEQHRIALEVLNIDAAVEDLKAKGVEMGRVGSAPDFFPSGMKNVFFTGPNGETLEFVEYAK